MLKSPADNLDILSLASRDLAISRLCVLVCLVAGALSLKAGQFGPGTGPIHIGSVSCDGSEQRIVDCQLRYENECVHNEDAGVTCPCKESLVSQ